MRRKSSNSKRGSAIVEMSLLSPWIFFLFVGALDWGFYAYSLITLENATRTAALYESQQTTTSSVTSSGACTLVLNEMSTLINMGSVTSCGDSPLVVTASTDTSTDGANEAIVSATYTTPQMIPVPGLLSGKFTITRTVKMKM
jgi:Flp pilus assembly protein TadG